MELDNWGKSDTPGQHVANTSWTWGEDEITWFGTQPDAYRHTWLQYAVDWLRNEDPRGHFEMPGVRGMVRPGANGSNYFAPWWPGDAAAIARVWAEQVPPTNSLRAGETLGSGAVLTSHAGKFTFQMQADGNLVQKNTGTNATVWASNTSGVGSELVMQWDGNLVVIAPSRAVLFQTGTAGRPGAYLLLQDDGNVVLYRANDEVVWKTKG